MKEIIERLESLEDLLQQVIVRIEEQGKREIKLPELKVPNYSGQLEQIGQELAGLKQQGSIESTVNQLEDVKKQLQTVRQLQLAKVLPQVKQYRFTFFPEQVRQPEYYKIMVLGFLGLVFLILTYLLLNKLLHS